MKRARKTLMALIFGSVAVYLMYVLFPTKFWGAVGVAFVMVVACGGHAAKVPAAPKAERDKNSFVLNAIFSPLIVYSV